jgi:ABC-type dipeptide/oligopeptide/nickel transport system permease component
MIEAIWQRDYPIIMGATLIGASAFVIANLLADIAYSFMDPRIRYN